MSQDEAGTLDSALTMLTGGKNCSLDAAGAGHDELGKVARQNSYLYRELPPAFPANGQPRARHLGMAGGSVTLRWAFFLWFFASTAFSQTPPPGSTSTDQSPAAAQTKPNAEDQEKPQDSANRSGPVAAFEVASIKLQPWTGGGSVGIFIRGNTLDAEHVSLFSLVTFAYNLRDIQLSGGPPWVRSGVLSSSELYQVMG